MIHHGDALAVLRGMRANTYHGCLTDPPYGLAEKRSPQRASGTMNKRGFMWMAWDADVPGVDTWREVLRVLKPGAFMLAFGGSRTHHRLMCAIEDAGFEIRDCVMWLYGSGFPKSIDISQHLDRRRDWPALDRFHATVKAARLKLGISQSEAARRAGIIAPGEKLAGGGFMWYETGRRIPSLAEYRGLKNALNLKGSDAAFEAAAREVIGTKRGKDCRAGDQFAPGRAVSIQKNFEVTAPATDAARQWAGYGTALKPAWEPIIVAMKPCDGTFARNASRHGVAGLAIEACQIGSAKRWPATVMLDEAAADALDAQSGHLTSGKNPTRRHSPKTRNTYGVFGGAECISRRGTDAGGASRFFYVAKAPKSERAGNNHPCVKPLALTEQLARLILPPTPGARLLVPFSGSGSEMLGARRAGWTRIDGIEQSAEYAAIAEARLEAA